jgi:hypothetical protein
MPTIVDGPASPLFRPVKYQGTSSTEELTEAGISTEMARAIPFAPRGRCVGWGIPFDSSDLVVARDRPIEIEFKPLRTRWLTISHTADLSEGRREPLHTFRFGEMPVEIRPPMALGGHVADYSVLYADGTSERVAIRRRHHINPFTSMWGENCFEAVTHTKPIQTRWGKSDKIANSLWGWGQTQAFTSDMVRLWINFLWSWKNPSVDKPIAGLRIEPKGDAVVIFGITASDVSSHPTRWRPRRKVLLRLTDGEAFDPSLANHGTQGLPVEEVTGGLAQIKLDLGQIIFAQLRPAYPNADWERTDYDHLPSLKGDEVLVEYTSHPDAHFHLGDGSMISVRELEDRGTAGRLELIKPAMKRIQLRAVEAGSNNAVPVRLHVHGESDEYLAPDNHHRIPNESWFQDYGADRTLQGHHAAYIPGSTKISVPLGKIYVEVSKGFEVRPSRKVVTIGENTEEVRIELERVLNWRDKGWITADTHVHFLSPRTALLEGEAEGVNIVNLLAAQWGELYTNIGDFDGKTTHGSREFGGSGEYLVRVGTENRQGTLGHISLLGYEGDIIRPLSAGGPAEAALGDPVNVLLTEWAARCKAQGGTVIIPHFPSPKCEHAVAIIEGHVDGVELTSLMDQAIGGLSPYSLADWYRYLNCGYRIAAVGGTDKMTSSVAVGEGRTYARIDPERVFDYEAWQEALGRAETFVTFGPLVDFTLDGNPLGSRIDMSASGGTVDVSWLAESATLPMTRLELVVNGETRESVSIDPWHAEGNFRLKIAESSWVALLVRASYPATGAEVIGAHTSPVMIDVVGSPFAAAADTMSILAQIEGAIAYLDTIAPQQDAATHKRLRLILTSAHRRLHNRMHAAGVFHEHTMGSDHPTHS